MSTFGGLGASAAASTVQRGLPRPVTPTVHAFESVPGCSSSKVIVSARAPIVIAATAIPMAAPFTIRIDNRRIGLNLPPAGPGEDMPSVRDPQIVICRHPALSSLAKRSLWSAATNHLLAIGIQGIVDDPLRRIKLVIIVEAEMPKALGNRIET